MADEETDPEERIFGRFAMAISVDGDLVAAFQLQDVSVDWENRLITFNRLFVFDEGMTGWLKGENSQFLPDSGVMTFRRPAGENSVELTDCQPVSFQQLEWEGNFNLDYVICCRATFAFQPGEGWGGACGTGFAG